VLDSENFESFLQGIDARRESMIERLWRLSSINSGSRNPDGVRRMAEELVELYGPLAPEVEYLDLPPAQEIDDGGNAVNQPLGPLVRLRKHPDASRKVLLVGHLDTVFGADHPFQSVVPLDDFRLNGPGVADLKGGLLVMHAALEALEASPWAGEVGWEVLLNPDEEIGSPGSAPLLDESARSSDVGLAYEPAMPDGTLAGARKGSGNFAAVFRGRAAHAGREHHLGRNAVRAAADFVAAIDDLNGQRDGVTVNAGFVHGGGPVNVVPDRAVVRFNIRLVDPADEDWLSQRLESIRAEISGRDGITAELHGRFGRSPKVLDAAHQQLFGHVRECGRLLGLDIQWRDTGGCCDGNNLSAAGLPNVDTLGVVGGNIHSDREYVELASLTERARLSAVLLMGLASGQLAWPARERGNETTGER
jgi:glutamate carboxypeptidase